MSTMGGPALTAPQSSTWTRTRRARQLIGRRSVVAVGAVIVAGLVLVALLAPWIAPHDTARQVGPVYGAPSAAHPLGLDDAGIDVLSLLIDGARVSLLVGFVATAVSMLVGGLVGVLSGYFVGAIDVVLMRVTDYLLAVPILPLMIVIAAVWGPSLPHIILVIGLLQWAWSARIIRAQVKTVRERLFITRTRSLGAGHGRILAHHVVPQITTLLLATTVLSLAYAVFAEAALAFLGLGDPGSTSWGTMIHNALEREAVSAGAWWAVVPPGICLALLIVGCHLFAEGINDALNPRLRTPHLSARTFRVRRSESGHRACGGAA